MTSAIIARLSRATARRTEADKPMTVLQTVNARRESEYVARRNGIKPPLLQLWRCS